MFEIQNKTLINEQLEKIRESSIEVSHVPIENIKPSPYQSRKTFDIEQIKELAETIKETKLAQPPIVRLIPGKDNEYQLVAGQRRLEACKYLGYDTVPVIIRTFTESEAQALNIIENIQRVNLNPIEEAEAIQQLINNHEYTHNDVAKRLGKSRTVITNLLRLLQGTESVKKALINDDIQTGHAKLLVSLTDEKQDELISVIVQGNLTVRETEALVKRVSDSRKPSKPSNLKINPKLELLSAKTQPFNIKCQPSKNGQGRVVIDFNSAADVDLFVKLFNDLSTPKS